MHINIVILLILILLIAPVMVNVTGGNTTQQAGQDYTLTCTVSGGEMDIPTYHWLQDGLNLINETSDTLSFTPLTQNSSDKYICVANKSGSVVESKEFAINVTGECGHSEDQNNCHETFLIIYSTTTDTFHNSQWITNGRTDILSDM